MTLEIIGAGLPRTGTLSLKHALEELGFGPCHHMTELLTNPPQWPKWESVFSGAPFDWEEVLAGYRSTADAPCCFFHRQLAARYPQAKIILSVRDADDWYRSVCATVGSPAHRAKLASSPVGGLMKKIWMRIDQELGADFGAPEFQNRDAAVANFHRYNESVERAIPPERLLVFHASEGWQPLCEFLGVPAPGKPYPQTNASESFKTGTVPNPEA